MHIFPAASLGNHTYCISFVWPIRFNKYFLKCNTLKTTKKPTQLRPPPQFLINHAFCQEAKIGKTILKKKKLCQLRERYNIYI